MLRLIARRVLFGLATMLVASILLFLLFELLPGDVAISALGPYSTEEQRQAWLLANGYDKPAVVRYLDWLSRFLTGDWGSSRILAAPVVNVVTARLWNTAILGFWFFVALQRQADPGGRAQLQPALRPPAARGLDGGGGQRLGPDTAHAARLLGSSTPYATSASACVPTAMATATIVQASSVNRSCPNDASRISEPKPL